MKIEIVGHWGELPSFMPMSRNLEGLELVVEKTTGVLWWKRTERRVLEWQEYTPFVGCIWVDEYGNKHSSAKGWGLRVNRLLPRYLRAQRFRKAACHKAE